MSPQLHRQSPRRLSRTSSHQIKDEQPTVVQSRQGEDDWKLLQEWMHHTDISYHHIDEQRASEIRGALVTWYRKNRRKLPWRGDPPPYDGSTAGTNKVVKTRRRAEVKPKVDDESPSATTSDSSNQSQRNDRIPVSAYGIWVSEIMLQQTRVEAVIPYWLKWMKSFPTVQDLANATEEEVNAHWAGLGFYRRARYLHQGAKYLVEEYSPNAELPSTVPELLKIPGIGRYTASAIASIAFDVRVPVVDGNVCRVLSRLVGVANHIKAPALKDKLGWDLAQQLVDLPSKDQADTVTSGNQEGNGMDNVTTDSPTLAAAWEINQALMELGATYCAPSGSGVDPRDPLKDYYLSTRLGRAYHTAMLSGKATLEDNVVKAVKSACSCPICDDNGVTAILEKFQDTIVHTETEEFDSAGESAAALGHAAFPLEPPKLSKRHEDLAVAVISNQVGNETWWLLVKRPSKGLLAGQWEFPSVCVQTKHGKPKGPKAKQLAPTIPARRTALNSYLQRVIENETADAPSNEWIPKLRRRLVNTSPLEHIFSHVQHNMWLETAAASVELEEWEWTTADGRQVRWMRETDMKEVGITSGVKKVLKAVKANDQEATGNGKSRKRKR